MAVDSRSAVYADSMRNGDISFWQWQLGEQKQRPALRGNESVDVCIVGGGFTGLWTAYYLKQARPDMKVAVLEKRQVGFGASGRNGGWIAATVPGNRRLLTKERGAPAMHAFEKAMEETVDEIINVAKREQIHADIVKHGVIEVARSGAQTQRLRAFIKSEREYGTSERDLAVLEQPQLDERIKVANAELGAWSPHCARVHPAKLVRGLADVVERIGVEIYEQTEVTAIHAHEAVTRQGTVRADYVIRCLEGFTSDLPGERRTWLPMNSAMVATGPLSDEQWSRIGWDGCELLGDMAHAYMYAQRTADGRIAFGGRGIPYRYASGHDRDGATQPKTIAMLETLVREFFPQIPDVAIEHAWCGVLGVSRDWCATVNLDRSTGLGHAGGYVGVGVAATNLAGRTLRDMILGETTPLTYLPWVGREPRKWEPEPLRWLGAQGIYKLYYGADHKESEGLGHTSRLATFADLVSGRH
jgi:glycine/D-amino acid oxidase-like deaminating enzyme